MLDPDTVYVFTFREPVRVVLDARAYRIAAVEGWLADKVSSDKLVGITSRKGEFAADHKWHAYETLPGPTTEVMMLVHVDNIAAAVKQGAA